MMIIRVVLVVLMCLNFILIFPNGKQLIGTDYIHSFDYDINNLIDNDVDTFFTIGDFGNYLEFRLESGKNVENIKFIFDSTSNDYEYKIYSSNDGYRYNNVEFAKCIFNYTEEIVNVSIEDEFIRIFIISSGSDNFVHIKEVIFYDRYGNRIKNVEIQKEDPVIDNVIFDENNKSYIESLEGLISRTLGEEYIEFFDIVILPNKFDKNYFRLYSNNGRITIAGDNVNSVAVALNYYFEHYLNQTFSRFGDSRLNVSFPLPEINNIVEKKIDIQYRFNYNYVSYGYTMAYWDFDDWEREIDWMALNGFNMALNLVGHEEVVRRFLSELGFSFSEIVTYLTSPIYLPWMFMGNISRIGGDITPEWFEDRARLSIDIQNRMKEFGIEPVHQAYLGYIPFREDFKFEILQGGYWSKIKGPDRLSFKDEGYEVLAELFYEKQKELLGRSKYFAGDMFHEGYNLYGYDVEYVSNKVLNVLKKNTGDDSIWVMQSWSHSPSSEVIESLDKSSILILDLHSQLNTKWKGQAKFNGMSWTEKEFNNSFWIFGVLNNFGGRSGLYGHGIHTIDQFYEAKDKAEFLVGIGQTSEAIGYNDFIDELVTELIFEDKLDINEFVKRYVINRYGAYNERLVKGFHAMVNTVYNAPKDIYHEGASESVINARPSFDITSSSKWGSIHKDYDSSILESALEQYLYVYDDFKHNKNYINDLVEIASQVISNLANDYYGELKASENLDEIRVLRDKFLYLINLQANILSHNDRKDLDKFLENIYESHYDDYFKDTLIYNKKMILTTWYDKLVSEDDGLRDYGNSDFYQLVGNLYYDRWKRFFDSILYDNEIVRDEYDDYKFDLKWVYGDDSLEFFRSDKDLKELVELVIVDISARRSGFSFVLDIIYSISSLFK